MRLQAPQPLGEHHSTTGFDCGDDVLNLWLEQRALGNQRSGATRTFVVCNTDGAVKAYVALASGAVAVAASPGRFRRNMPDPIPVVVLARLAVCSSIQGQGIARALLADAFERVLRASKQIGMLGQWCMPPRQRPASSISTWASIPRPATPTRCSCGWSM